jgi:hypothetical protein
MEFELSASDADIFNDKMTELKQAEMYFRRVCSNINLLDSKLDALTCRYQRNRDSKAISYNLRLQLATMEGLRATYYEYACRKGQVIVDLRCLLADMVPA